MPSLGGISYGAGEARFQKTESFKGSLTRVGDSGTSLTMRGQCFSKYTAVEVPSQGPGTEMVPLKREI